MDYFFIQKAPATVSVTVTDADYATFSYPYAVDFSDTGVKAYIAQNKDGEITFSEVTSVPANTGVLLQGAGDYTFKVIASSNTDVEGNALLPSSSSKKPNAGIFVLLNGNKGVGFYKTHVSFDLTENTAYIDKVVAGEAREFIPLGEATAIKTIEAEQLNGEIYNLAGQRVKSAKKGLYIMDGKKVIK